MQRGELFWYKNIKKFQKSIFVLSKLGKGIFMDKIVIQNPLIEGELIIEPDKKVQISIVLYEHEEGIPARFCAGLIPALALVRQLESNSVKSTIRLIDPTPIANYCNGWKMKQSCFRDIVVNFLDTFGADYFFDEAEKVDVETLGVLENLGKILELSEDEQVVDMIQRIKESGRKHGGEHGVRNSVLYMAAHPFSWLDMYHPLVWKTEYSSDSLQFLNLMSKPEKRFAVVRKFLQESRSDLCTKNNSVDLYMSICNTPCYIPLADEPKFSDLESRGYDWCLKRYLELKVRNNNYNRVYRDFLALNSFLGKDLL